MNSNSQKVVQSDLQVPPTAAPVVFYLGKLRLELVHNWRRVWTFFSMQAMAAAVAFPAALSVLPERYQNAIPDKVVLWITAFLVIVGMAGRMIKQKDKQ